MRVPGSSEFLSHLYEGRILRKRVRSEDDDAVDQDDPMDQDPSPAAADSKSKGNDDLAQYNLDDYDDDDSIPGLVWILHVKWMSDTFLVATGPFSNIKGLTYYRNNDEDPYITLKQVRLLLTTSLEKQYP